MMRIAALLLIPFLLAGCDVVKDRMGIKDPVKVEAEAKAIGASCRLSGRGLEDCYNLNPGSPRAAIYAGWREMNEYMAERKMEAQPPELDAEGKPIAAHDEATKSGDKEPAKADASGKESAKEPVKEAGKSAAAKTEAGQEAGKDIRPKLKPDLSKEAAAAKR
ncbi:hypothetical protein [Sulfuritortus calidifontis]|nr:hypothetical protein [Sulfuritortus calidifontis]